MNNCKYCGHCYSAHRTKNGRPTKCHIAKVDSFEEVLAKCPCKKCIEAKVLIDRYENPLREAVRLIVWIRNAFTSKTGFQAGKIRGPWMKESEDFMNAIRERKVS